MTVITSKICVVGDFAVGKTSTTERFVNAHFSDKYLTTIGIKVDTKSLTLGDIEHKLVIWDVAGTDSFGETELAYIRGSSGYLLVADGTRYETVEVAERLRSQIETRYGEIPHVFLINKSDLPRDREITEEKMISLRQVFEDIYFTSAKTGSEVDTAIVKLVERLVEALPG